MLKLPCNSRHWNVTKLSTFSQNLREKEDIADEDEVRQLLQQELDEDGEVLFTEQGYEADTETSISYDWKKG